MNSIPGTQLFASEAVELERSFRCHHRRFLESRHLDQGDLSRTGASSSLGVVNMTANALVTAKDLQGLVG